MNSDTLSEFRKSGSRLIDIGCLTQVCGGILISALIEPCGSVVLMNISLISFSTIRRSTDTQTRCDARRTVRDAITKTVSRAHRHTPEMARSSHAFTSHRTHGPLERVKFAILEYGQLGSSGYTALAHLRGHSSCCRRRQCAVCPDNDVLKNYRVGRCAWVSSRLSP